MTSWELDERAAKSKFVAQVGPLPTIRNNKLNTQREKLETAKLRAFVSRNISSLPSIKVAINEIRVFVSRSYFYAFGTQRKVFILSLKTGLHGLTMWFLCLRRIIKSLQIIVLFLQACLFKYMTRLTFESIKFYRLLFGSIRELSST